MSLPKDFSCEVCAATFTRRDTLKRHHNSKHASAARGGARAEMSKPSLEIIKPFMCGDCNATFTRKDLLKRHCDSKHASASQRVPAKLSLEIIKLFLCGECDTAFTHRDNLKRHYQLMHRCDWYEGVSAKRSKQALEVTNGEVGLSCKRGVVIAEETPTKVSRSTTAHIKCILCGLSVLRKNYTRDLNSLGHKTEVLEGSLSDNGIRQDDIVSKMVCHRCCRIVENFYRYRTEAVANDKLLKEQLGQVYVPPLTDTEELRRIGERILSNTDCDIQTEPDNFTVTSELVNAGEVIPKNTQHHSITNLIQKYPGIKLPAEVNNCDIAPDVTLDDNEVMDWHEEYFRRCQIKLKLANIVIKKVHDVSNKHEDVERKSSNAKDEPPIFKISLEKGKLPLSVIAFRKIDSRINNNCNDVKHSPSILHKPISKTLLEKNSVLLGNTIIKRIDNSVNNIERKSAKTKFEKQFSQIPLEKEHASSSLVINNSVNDICESVDRGTLHPITKVSLANNDSFSTHEPIPEIAKVNTLRLTSNSFVCKPCPKSKKVPALSKIISNPAEKLPTVEDLIENYKDGMSSQVDVSSTQINHISTTTDEPVFSKKKRKLRTKPSNSELTLDEVVPNKKKCLLFSNNTLDIPKCIPNYSKDVLPDVGVMHVADVTCLTVNEEFVCQICLRVYDTNKQLRIHQRRHFSCKFCGLHTPSLKRLQIHENKKCHVKIVNNQPKLQLVKVDQIQSIVNKFREAFMNDEMVGTADVDTDTSHSLSTTKRCCDVSRPNSGMVYKQCVTGSKEFSSIATDNTVLPALDRQISLAYSKQVTVNAPRSTIIHTTKVPSDSRGPIIAHSNKVPQNISIQTSFTTYGRTPPTEDFLFTDAELIDMLQEPLTSDHLPNTTFHYASDGSISESKGKESVHKSSPISKPALEPKRVHDSQAQPVSGSNINIHQVVSANGALSKKKVSYSSNSDTRFVSGYLQSDTAFASDFYQKNNLQTSEWLQSDLSRKSKIQMSKGAGDSVQQLNRSQGTQQIVSMPPTTSATSPYTHYPTSSVEQINYNLQSGYQYQQNIIAQNGISGNDANSGNMMNATPIHNTVAYNNFSTTYYPIANAMPNPQLNNGSIPAQNINNTTVNVNVNQYSFPDRSLSNSVPTSNRFSNTTETSGLPQTRSMPLLNQITNTVQPPKYSSKMFSNRQNADVQYNMNPQLINNYPNPKQPHNLQYSVSNHNPAVNNTTPTSSAAFQYSHPPTQPINHSNAIQGWNHQPYEIANPSQLRNNNPLSNDVFQYLQSGYTQSVNQQSNFNGQMVQNSMPCLANINSNSEFVNSRRPSNPALGSTNSPKIHPNSNAMHSPPSYITNKNASSKTTVPEVSPSTNGVLRVKQFWKLL